MISLWMEQVAPQPERPALQRHTDTDVVIVGAGFTGLWTAYYLKQLQPQLRITILEARQVGYGASGRNGGWLLGEIAGGDKLLQALPEAERQAGHRLLQSIPDEVAQVTGSEGIQCDFKKGGVLYCAARYPEQEQRLQAHLAECRNYGYSSGDLQWLDQAGLQQRLQMAHSYGALFSPHCATVQPAKLALGLAAVLEQSGVEIFGNSPVVRWQSGEVATPAATVRARWVVPAVEAYGSQLKPMQRYQLAVQSMIVATEPLPESVWQSIGLANGEAFCEASRLISYGQRSADNRMIFGARGGYRFGGRLRIDAPLSAGEMELRRHLMQQCFPQLEGVRITHNWGGNLALSRRFHPHMLCDYGSRIAVAGGYAGEGVGASNLAGRTLAHLITEQESELVRQPWVLRDKPISALKRWEPEPLRWLTYKTVNQLYALEDRVLSAPTPAWQRRLVSGLADVMEGVIS